MKTLYVFALALICFSCHQPTTEEKIAASIENITKTETEKSGTSVEYIKVDSVQYQNVSLEYYFMDLHHKIEKMRDDYSVGLTENDTASLNELQKIDSVIFPYVNSLRESADLSPTLYLVKYHYILKTNKQSEDSRNVIFLYQKDLQYVRAYMDSIAVKMGVPKR